MNVNKIRRMRGFKTFRTVTFSYQGVSNSDHSPDLNPNANPLTLTLQPNPNTNPNPNPNPNPSYLR